MLAHAPASAPFLRSDLPALGLSPRRLRLLLRDGLVSQPLHRVYAATALLDDPATRAAALALVLPPGAAIARGAAAWFHGFDPRGPAERTHPLVLECVVPAGREPVSRPGVKGYAARLPPSDVVRLHGVPVTSVERTALDVARYLPSFMGLAVLDAMAHRGDIDPARLADRIEEWRGERYVDQARRVIHLCEPDTESYGESWLRLRIVDAGFPRPEPQIWVTDHDGVLVYRLDMGWRAKRIGMEYDGEEFHSERISNTTKTGGNVSTGTSTGRSSESDVARSSDVGWISSTESARCSVSNR